MDVNSYDSTYESSDIEEAMYDLLDGLASSKSQPLPHQHSVPPISGCSDVEDTIRDCVNLTCNSSGVEDHWRDFDHDSGDSLGDFIDDGPLLEIQRLPQKDSTDLAITQTTRHLRRRSALIVPSSSPSLPSLSQLVGDTTFQRSATTKSL